MPSCTEPYLCCLFRSIKLKGPWIKVQSKTGGTKLVLHEFTDVEWRDNSRMAKQSFMKLCSSVQRHTEHAQKVTGTEGSPTSVYVANVFLSNGLSDAYTTSFNQIHFSTGMEYFIPIELFK